MMNLFLLFSISLFGSFIFALGGVGAAIILIPVLVSLGIPIQIAKPVGLFFNTVSLLGASIHNIKNKRLDVKAGIPVIVFSLLFAPIGAYISKFFPIKIMLLVFILFLLLSSGMFFLHSKSEKSVDISNTPYLKLSLIGVISGLVSGLLGVGGGGIISPLMLSLGYDSKKIATTTAFVVPFSSLAGFFTYWAMGSVDWTILFIASLGGLLGALLGTKFMHDRLNSRTVKKVLGSILFFMALKLLIKLL